MEHCEHRWGRWAMWAFDPFAAGRALYRRYCHDCGRFEERNESSYQVDVAKRLNAEVARHDREMRR